MARKRKVEVDEEATLAVVRQDDGADGVTPPKSDEQAREADTPSLDAEVLTFHVGDDLVEMTLSEMVEANADIARDFGLDPDIEELRHQIDQYIQWLEENEYEGVISAALKSVGRRKVSTVADDQLPAFYEALKAETPEYGPEPVSEAPAASQEAPETQEAPTEKEDLMATFDAIAKNGLSRLLEMGTGQCEFIANEPGRRTNRVPQRPSATLNPRYYEQRCRETGRYRIKALSFTGTRSGVYCTEHTFVEIRRSSQELERLGLALETLALESSRLRID